MSMLSVLAVTWAAETAVLIGLLIYRALLGMREEDRLFLSAGEVELEREQLQLQSKIVHLNKYAVWLGIVSGVLVLVIGGIWGYQEFKLH